MSSSMDGVEVESTFERALRTATLQVNLSYATTLKDVLCGRFRELGSKCPEIRTEISALVGKLLDAKPDTQEWHARRFVAALIKAFYDADLSETKLLRPTDDVVARSELETLRNLPPAPEGFEWEYSILCASTLSACVRKTLGIDPLASFEAILDQYSVVRPDNVEPEGSYDGLTALEAGRRGSEPAASQGTRQASPASDSEASTVVLDSSNKDPSFFMEHIRRLEDIIKELEVGIKQSKARNADLDRINGQLRAQNTDLAKALSDGRRAVSRHR